MIKVLTSTWLLFVVFLVTPAGAPSTPCEPAQDVRFICDHSGPEDLAVVPGGRWVIASSLSGSGALRLISVADGATTPMFPAPSSRVRPHPTMYGSCPAPLRAEGQKIQSHGLSLVPGTGSVHRLFVVYHGSRESVEMFEIDAGATQPTATWIGCVIAPDQFNLNGVVGLRDGGFIATRPRVLGDTGAISRARAGENTGAVWEWHPATGWAMVPGSEEAFPNGVEISRDGKWVYVAGYGRRTVIRLSRGVTPVKKDSVFVGFEVDNLRWAPDGVLLATGEADKASRVARVDPQTLKHEEILALPDTTLFHHASTAVQIGRELWLGSASSARIARVRLPR